MTFRKDPKMPVQFCDDPPKYPQNLHTQKNIHFSENQKKYSTKFKVFEPLKMVRAYVYMKIISEYPPPPPGVYRYKDWSEFSPASKLCVYMRVSKTESGKSICTGSSNPLLLDNVMRNKISYVGSNHLQVKFKLLTSNFPIFPFKFILI